jgi:hypothetical protein
MQFGAVQLEKWARTQPIIAFRTLEFHFSVFAFSGAHMAPILLHCINHCCLLQHVLLFLAGLWMRLLFFVLWCEVEIPFPLSVLGPFLNYCCDNFEQCELRMIKLLRIVSHRKWKISFLNF